MHKPFTFVITHGKANTPKLIQYTSSKLKKMPSKIYITVPGSDNNVPTCTTEKVMRQLDDL